MSKVYIQQRGRIKLSWAVMVEGRKNAIKVFDDLDLAYEFATSIKPPILMNYWLINVKNIKGDIIYQRTKIKKVPVND